MFVEPIEGWRFRSRCVGAFDLFGMWMNRSLSAGVSFLASVLPSVIFVLGR
jgi:hypothetical protein